jgi:hypothetical protein
MHAGTWERDTGGRPQGRSLACLDRKHEAALLELLELPGGRARALREDQHGPRPLLETLARRLHRLDRLRCVLPVDPHLCGAPMYRCRAGQRVASPEARGIDACCREAKPGPGAGRSGVTLTVPPAATAHPKIGTYASDFFARDMSQNGHLGFEGPRPTRQKIRIGGERTPGAGHVAEIGQRRRRRRRQQRQRLQERRRISAHSGVIGTSSDRAGSHAAKIRGTSQSDS